MMMTGPNKGSTLEISGVSCSHFWLALSGLGRETRTHRAPGGMWLPGEDELIGLWKHSDRSFLWTAESCSQFMLTR